MPCINFFRTGRIATQLFDKLTKKCTLMKKIGLLLLLVLLQQSWLLAQDFSKMTKKEGFVPFYLDEEKGKIYLEISSLNQEIGRAHV